MRFDEEYQQNTKQWTLPDEQLTEWLKAVTAGRALDLGAGEGGNSFWLAERGWDVTSIDSSESAVQFIEGYSQEKGYSVKAEVADARTYTSESAFDLILLSFVHFSKEDREALFGRLDKQLVEGGLFIYLGLIKTEDELPPGGLLEEFPASDEVAREVETVPSLFVIDQGNVRRELPIGIKEGMYLAQTSHVKVRKGRG